METEYQKYKLNYSVAETGKNNQEKKRTRESYLKELERLNLLFQKERISWEYYDREYGKIQDKLKTFSTPERKSKKNINYLDKILRTGFKEMYESLSKENRQSFWQNTIREIYLGDDSAVTSIEFY